MKICLFIEFWLCAFVFKYSTHYAKYFLDLFVRYIFGRELGGKKKEVNLWIFICKRFKI